MKTPIFEKKNVVVTGGAGFIGAHLCERLLKEAKVICVDDFSNSRPENINHLLQHQDFEFINFDVNKPLALDQFKELEKFKIKFQGIQEVYHLACPTSPKFFEATRLKILATNSLGTINTLDLAAKYSAKFVFSSSAVVYGDDIGERNAIKEEDLGAVNQLSKRACYDEGKRFAEACVATYSQALRLDAKIARVFTTYGPYLRLFEGQLIPDFIISALEGKDMVLYGDKKLATSLCYVSDAVDGLVRLMAAGEDVKVVNIGGEEVIKYTDVAEMIIKLTHSSSKLVFGDPLFFLSKKGAPDLTYVKEALGWFPLVRLEEGLRQTIDYVIANKEALLFDGKRRAANGDL